MWKGSIYDLRQLQRVQCLVSNATGSVDSWFHETDGHDVKSKWAVFDSAI